MKASILLDTVPGSMPNPAYATAVLAPEEDIPRQYLDGSQTSHFHQLLDGMSEIVAVLNQERQIVFANEALLIFLGLTSMQPILGHQIGEVLSCVHAFESHSECGATEYCQTCGADMAIRESQHGQKTVQEYRVMRKENGEALDLRVWTTPYDVGAKRLIIFAASDISHEKRRRALESIFLHDVLNTVTSMRGYIELMTDATAQELAEFHCAIQQLSDQLLDEINAQKELLAAENNELVVHPATLNSVDFLREVVNTCNRSELATARTIRVDAEAQALTLVSDRTLLRRVMVNLLKNALEASQPGEVVTAGCRMANKHVEFWVHNPGYIPRFVQLQIFQRSFSTKGQDRGLGTYSIKLLSERYLGGYVSFATDPHWGTTFRARYPLVLPTLAAVPTLSAAAVPTSCVTDEKVAPPVGVSSGWITSQCESHRLAQQPRSRPKW